MCAVPQLDIRDGLLMPSVNRVKVSLKLFYLLSLLTDQDLEGTFLKSVLYLLRSCRDFNQQLNELT